MVSIVTDLKPRRASDKRTALSGETLNYKLERESDGEFHCPCSNTRRSFAKNIATHCRACRAGFVAELTRIAALEVSLGQQEGEAMSTEEAADNDTLEVDNQIGHFRKGVADQHRQN